MTQNMEEKDVLQEEAVVEEQEQQEEAPAEAAEMTPEELAELLIQMGKEKEAADERYLRLQADFDNYRKRTLREREDVIKQANSGLFKLLLPVVDNLERASALPEDANVGAVIEGLRKILKQVAFIMAANDVEPIVALDADFDPKIHEAVMQEDAGEEKSGKVIEELQRGYTMGGKLLRPSMVKVGK